MPAAARGTYRPFIDGGPLPIPSEPFNVDQVIAIAKRLNDQPGFQTWRARNAVRHALTNRLLPVEIEGISQKLEYKTPDLEYHGKLWVSALDDAKVGIQVSARDGTPRGMSAAQKVENFFYTIYYDMARHRTGLTFAPRRRALHQQTH